MRKYNNNILFLILVTLLFASGSFYGCMPKQDMKPFSEMTPKEKGVFFLSVYNSQAEDYKALAANPAALTEDHKKILREKKKLLTEVYPLIQTYQTYVDAMTQPSAELEAQISGIINSLMTTVLPKIE